MRSNFILKHIFIQQFAAVFSHLFLFHRQFLLAIAYFSPPISLSLFNIDRQNILAFFTQYAAIFS